MFFSSNQELVDTLIREGYLKTPILIDAFLKIDRRGFVLQEAKEKSYENYPLPIGFNQTISQPLTVAFMLEELNPLPEEKILDVGAGSGWQTSLLAYITSRDISNLPLSSPLIIAIERIKELKEMAEKNVSKFNFIKKGIVKIVLGDGSKGYKEEAPYDKIIAAADVGREIPQEWREQLKIGGRIVAPSAERIIVLDKKGKEEFEEKVYFGFNFVPLIRD